MSISKRWSKPSKVNKAPPKPGVYEFADKRGKITKIGEGSNLNERMPSSLAEAGRQVKAIRWKEARNHKALELKMLEAFKEKYGKLPKLNKRMS